MSGSLHQNHHTRQAVYSNDTNLIFRDTAAETGSDSRCAGFRDMTLRIERERPFELRHVGVTLELQQKRVRSFRPCMDEVALGT